MLLTFQNLHPMLLYDRNYECRKKKYQLMKLAYIDKTTLHIALS